MAVPLNWSSWRAGKLARRFGEGATSQLWLTLDYPQPPDGPTAEQSKWVEKVNGPDNVRLFESGRSGGSLTTYALALGYGVLPSLERDQ